MTKITDQHICPVCDGYMGYDGICHTCGFHERQYADPKEAHPRALKRIGVRNVRYGC